MVICLKQEHKSHLERGVGEYSIPYSYKPINASLQLSKWEINLKSRSIIGIDKEGCGGGKKVAPEEVKQALP